MTTTHSPIGAGFVAPESDDAQAAGAGLGIKGQGKADSANRTDDGHAAQIAADKEFANVAARAASAGAGLYSLAGGGYLLTRWQMVKELPSLRAVGQLLDAMGVRA